MFSDMAISNSRQTNMHYVFPLMIRIMRNRSCLFYFPFSFHFSVLSTYTEKDAGASLHISPVIKPDFYILHLAADCIGLMVASMGPFPE